MAGTGTKLGFMIARRMVPTVDSVVEKAKPGIDRSIKYHSTGLANASVDET